MARNRMRNKMRDALKKKTNDSYNRRNSSGNIKTFFDPDKMSDVRTWWASKGDHIIDIIPYEAGSKDPRNSKGEYTYVLDIEVHRNVGPTDEMIVCLEQYGKPCPICMEMRRLKSVDADWKTEIKPLKPSRRCVYNVIVRDGGKQEKLGVQVFEIAHFFMEKHLAKIAKDPRTGGIIVFADPDDGKSITFERTGSSTNTSYDGHRFLDRSQPITEEELEQAYCLDELLLIRSYDDIYELFHGKAPGNEDENEDSVVDEAPVVSKKELKKKLKKIKKKKCPGKGKIGKSIDELDECEECDYYDDCAFLADNM